VAPGCDHCRHNCADHSRIPCTPDCVVAVDPGAGRRRCHPRRPWQSLSSPGSDRCPPTPLRAPLRAPGSGRDDARSGGNIRRREGGATSTSLLRGGGAGCRTLLDPPGRRGKATAPPSPRAPTARSGGGAAGGSVTEGRWQLTLAAHDVPRERAAGVFF
jgi:hypothetical protein